MKKVSLRALRPRKAISGTNHWLETLAFNMTVVYHYKEWLLSLSYPERPAAPFIMQLSQSLAISKNSSSMSR